MRGKALMKLCATIAVIDVMSHAISNPTSRSGKPVWGPTTTISKGKRMPKADKKNAVDKERAKTEKLLRKVGYTALKEAGVQSKRPDLPNLKIDKRGT